jgi:hypothetical protein
MAAALLIRVLFLSRLSDNYDLQSYALVAQIVDRGGDFYGETSRYNYSPVWAYVVWGLWRISRFFGMSFGGAVAALLLAVDAASALLISRILREKGRSRSVALLAASLFFANPISILVSSRLVMFDNVSILFLLVAVGAMARSPARRGAAVAGLTASLLVKHVTWFHPLLLPRRREPRAPVPLALLPYALFVASLLPFHRSWRAIRAHVFGYQSLGEPYGTEPLRFLPFMPAWGTTAIFAGAGLLTVFLLWRREIEFGRACLILFLVLLLFVPGIAVYYFVWPVALGALYPSVGYAVYTVVVTLFLMHSPDGLAVELPHLPGWSGPWWALAFWLLWEVRRSRRSTADSRQGGTPSAV